MQTMTEQTAEQALTHHVRLVLDNDEPTYLERRAIVQAFMASDDAQYPHLLGDQLKDWCESLAIPDPDGDGMTMLALEIIGTALAFVDWRGLAVDYIAEEAE